MLFQALGPDPPERQHHRACVGHVDAALRETVEHVPGEAAAAVDQFRRDSVHHVQVDKILRGSGVLDEPRGEELRVDDLVDVGDALVLGDRHGVNRMTRSLAAERPDIRLEVAREACVVAGATGAIADRVAEDHGADAGAHLCQRPVESEPQKRRRKMVAVAMRKARADELLDDVFLNEHHAEGRARIGEEAGETVVEI